MTNSLPTGHILQNEYKIEKVLGAGGFGITYLARDTNLNYQVVIKEFLPQDMATRDQSRIIVTPFTKDTQSYKHLLKRFSEEAQLLAKMRHPNIVKVTRFFKENNTAYFVMEYAEGETLKDYLKRNNTLTEEEILSIMMPILEGAKYVHEQGFLHRDIAPDNIYLTKNGMPILIDFGAARDAIAEESKNISSIVKEGYSSPEQYTINNKQNASSDIYALGAVFYRLITGKVPIGASHRQNVLLNDGKDPLEDISKEYAGRYSTKLLNAVKKAMSIKVKDRFDSVQDLQEALLSQSHSRISKETSTQKLFIITGIILSLLMGLGYVILKEKSSKDENKSATAYVIPSHKKELEKVKRDLEELKTKHREKRQKIIEKKEQESKKIEKEKLVLEKQKLEEKKHRLKKENIAKMQVQSRNIEGLLRKAKDYYYGSNGVLKDYAKAEDLFIEAAEENSAEAFRFLGTIFLFGNGVNADSDLASELLLKAIELGDMRAKELYACYIKDSKKVKYKIENLPRNDSLNVRGQPLSTTNAIDKIDNKIGAVTVLDKAENNDGTKWSKIKYCRTGTPNYGWVASRYLVPAYTSYSKSKRYKIINIKQGDTLNMRTGPGSQYNKIGEVLSGAKNLALQQCKLSTKGGRWCKIEYGSYVGWVSALYLREQ